MRHFYIVALLPILLTSCSCNEIGSNETKQSEKNYDDYIAYTIEWNTIFDYGLDVYHVYVFSKTCGHCNKIKEKIFQLADVTIPNFYFCEYDETIPIKLGSSNTIGISCYEGAYVCGTPSLIIINLGVIVSNLCGENAIITYINDYLEN